MDAKNQESFVNFWPATPSKVFWGHYFDCFWGLPKSENGIGCFPLTHHLGGGFDHGRIMRPGLVVGSGWLTCNEVLGIHPASLEILQTR